MNILFKISILFLFENYFSEWSEYTKYMTTNLKFSIYRSFCCLMLCLHAFINILIEPSFFLTNIFYYNSYYINNLNYWFISYIIVDLFFMLFYRINRKDLYFHHIFFFFAGWAHRNVYMVNIVLLGEALSVISALDTYYIESKLFYKSYICKKIRKNIIIYLRFPIWIFLIISALINYSTMNNYQIGFISIGSILAPYLDYTWVQKCQKVIDKYENNKQ